MKTQQEIIKQGYQALIETLGAMDTIRFIQYFSPGQGDYTKALDYLTQCLQRNPRHFEAHYNLGNVYSELGNLDLAKVHYELSMKQLPEGDINQYDEIIE